MGYFGGGIAGAPVPTGTILPYGGSEPPEGFLLCDGAAVSRQVYADLFATLSTAYGPGDGETTFNLPDYRGRAPVGAGEGQGLTPRSRGQAAGAETVTLTAAQSGLPGHDHGASSDQVQVQLSDGGHQHDELCEMPGSAGTCIVYGVGDGQNPVIGGMTGTSTANISAQTHDHVISVEPVQAAGAQDSHENMPPFLVAAFIIKT